MGLTNKIKYGALIIAALMLAYIGYLYYLNEYIVKGRDLFPDKGRLDNDVRIMEP